MRKVNPELAFKPQEISITYEKSRSIFRAITDRDDLFLRPQAHVNSVNVVIVV